MTLPPDNAPASRAHSFQVVAMILSIIAFLLLLAETYLAEKGFYARTSRSSPPPPAAAAARAATRRPDTLARDGD